MHAFFLSPYLPHCLPTPFTLIQSPGGYLVRNVSQGSARFSLTLNTHSSYLSSSLTCLFYNQGNCDISVWPESWSSKNCAGYEEGLLIRGKILRFFDLHTNILTFWRRNYFFLILAHLVYKIWIIQELNKLELWNKLHFEEGKNREYIPCLKYSVLIFVE